MVIVQIILEHEWHSAAISLNFLKYSVYVAVSNEVLEKVFTSHFSTDMLVELCHFLTQYKIYCTRFMLVTHSSDLVHPQLHTPSPFFLSPLVRFSFDFLCKFSL